MAVNTFKWIYWAKIFLNFINYGNAFAKAKHTLQAFVNYGRWALIYLTGDPGNVRRVGSAQPVRADAIVKAEGVESDLWLMVEKRYSDNCAKRHLHEVNS